MYPKLFQPLSCPQVIALLKTKISQITNTLFFYNTNTSVVLTEVHTVSDANVCVCVCEGSRHALVLQPALVLKVELLQILQRDVLLFFSASQVQPL